MAMKMLADGIPTNKFCRKHLSEYYQYIGEMGWKLYIHNQSCIFREWRIGALPFANAESMSLFKFPIDQFLARSGVTRGL
jgi:hypothetical protein